MILYVSYVTINYLCSYFFFKLSMNPPKIPETKIGTSIYLKTLTTSFNIKLNNVYRNYRDDED